VNEMKRPKLRNIDAEWNEHRDNIESLILKLSKNLHDVEGLPEDINSPETEKEVKAVKNYSTQLILLSDDLSAAIDDLSGLNEHAEKGYEDRMDEMGETMSDDDRMREAGHNNGDF